MIISITKSVNGIKIRLTEERWHHIEKTHEEIKDKDFPKIMKVVSKPGFILKGSKGECLAVTKVTRKKNWLVVPYKEVNQEDGFVLTAYFSSDLTWLLKKEIIWSKQS